MGKKKKMSGKHTTTRRAVQLPEDWVKVAQDMATERPMPLMWYIVELIRKEAEAKGRKDLPPPPWQSPAGG